MLNRPTFGGHIILKVTFLSVYTPDRLFRVVGIKSGLEEVHETVN